MTALWGLLGQLLGAIVGPLAEAWRQWRAERTARDAGRQEQRAADLAAGMKEARDANQARGSVGGSDDDVDRMLRPPGARGRP